MKKMPLTTTIGLVFCLLGLTAYAQQDAMYTHYMFNTQSINPAYAGSRPAFTLTTLHRSQWSAQFPGHPVTQTLGLQTPLKRENMGLGLSLYNDKLGVEKTTSVYVDYSYRIRVSESGLLFMGIKGGVSMHSIDYNELYGEQPDDPVLRNREHSMWLPNVGFGLYYLHESFFAGFSVPQLMQENFLDNSVYGGAKFALKQRHYYFIAGTALDINQDVTFAPSSYVKFTQGAPAEMDLTASFYFYDRFSIGAMFRIRDSVGALAGLRITDKWVVGYSYDWAIANQIPNNNFGSHEIVLRYDFRIMGDERIKMHKSF
jgi:type IX secretion system PorP/SprF family membrane protein